MKNSKSSAQKGSSSRKAAAPQKTYEYQKLSDCKPGTDKVYVYGVILDAQFPHKSFKSEKYVCSMKITDASMKVDKETGNIDFCTLVLFASKFEDLPISQKVGDIIRIHRATVGLYKNQKQFTANIFFNSSWALFSPQTFKNQPKDIEFRPNQFFGKQLSFDNREMHILRQTRKWISQVFVDHTMLSCKFITELQHLNEMQKDDKHFDFDLQVKILQIFKLDDYTSEIRVIDATNEVWHAQILTQKFKWIREGQYVRIRQATLQNHKNYSHVFGLKMHSNILSLPDPCKLSDEMFLNESEHVKKYEFETLTKSVDGQKGIAASLQHPMIVSKLEDVKDDSDYQFPITSLKQLVGSDDGKRKPVLGLENNQGVFRCRFSVCGFNIEECKEGEINHLNFVKVLNTKTRQIRDLARSEKSDKQLKGNEKLCIFVQMVCKDASLIFSNDFIRINIVQESGVPGFFPGISASDLLNNKKNNNAPLRFVSCLQTLMRFNVNIEALLCLTDQYQLSMSSLGYNSAGLNTDAKNGATATKWLVVSNDTKLKVFN